MKTFSRSWKSSKKVRKQRKYRSNLPLHLRSKLVHVHLSKELHQKYNRRSVVVRLGDKVRVMRGKFRKSEGKVDRIDRKREALYITGIELIKKEGAKVLLPIHPSNVLIVELKLDDKKRKEKLEVAKK